MAAWGAGWMATPHGGTDVLESALDAAGVAATSCPRVLVVFLCCAACFDIVSIRWCVAPSVPMFSGPCHPPAVLLS